MLAYYLGRREKAILRIYQRWKVLKVNRLLEGGIPYPVMASMMGWSAATAIRMSKRYGHIGSKALRDAAELLGGLEIAPESLKNPPKSPNAESPSIQ